MEITSSSAAPAPAPAPPAAAGVIHGPWRATRLWNDIVRGFHAGMPTKKHRVRMRTVENCFSGAEALDWMHKNLKKNPNFGPEVTREQTTQLLHKILRAGIVECVHSSHASQNSLFGSATPAPEGGGAMAGAQQVFSTGDLYRFVDAAAENLRTPGKKSPAASKISRREALAAMGNTPIARGGARASSVEARAKQMQENVGDSEWETRYVYYGEEISRH